MLQEVSSRNVQLGLKDRIDSVTAQVTNGKESIRQAILQKSSSYSPPANPTFQQIVQGVQGIITQSPSITVNYSNYTGEKLASGGISTTPTQNPSILNFEHNVGHPLYSQFSYYLNGSKSYRFDLKTGLYTTINSGISPNTVDGDLITTLPWGSVGLAVIFNKRLSSENYPIYFFNSSTNTSSLITTFSSDYDNSVGWCQMGAYDTSDSILYLVFNDYNTQSRKTFRLSVNRSSKTITTIASDEDSTEDLNGCDYTNLGLMRWESRNIGYQSLISWRFFTSNAQIYPTQTYDGAFDDSPISNDWIVEYFIKNNKNLLVCSYGNGANLYNKNSKTRTTLISGVSDSYSLGGYLDNSTGLLYIGFIGEGSSGNNYYAIVYQTKYNLPIIPGCSCRFNKVVYKSNGSSISANSTFTSGDSHYTTEKNISGTVTIPNGLVVS